MSKESAQRFVEAYLRRDAAIEEKVLKLPKERGGSPELLAEVGNALGYDVTPLELSKAFHEHLAAQRAQLDGEELSGRELTEVTGGKPGDRPFDLQACLDDYNPDSWCWFTDKCDGMSVHYRRYGVCHDTFEPGVKCMFTDACDKDTTYYRSPYAE